MKQTDSEGKLQTTRNGNVLRGIVRAFAISWSVKQRYCRNPFSNFNEIDQCEKQNVCDNLEKMQQVVIANLLLEKTERGQFRFMAVLLQSLVAPGAQLLLSGKRYVQDRSC